MTKTRIAYLIKRFRAAKATPEELDELESFWSHAQQDDTMFNVFTDDEKETLRAAMLEKIKSSVGIAEARAGGARIRVLSRGLKVAASITVVLGVVFFLYLSSEREHTIQTVYGQQRMIHLPDSSQVILNGNSTLRYLSSWRDGTDREVWIDGEAFFEVTHKHNNQKFVVHAANGMTVEVLGTKFNVKVRRSKAEVMLQEGKVRLDINNETTEGSLTMLPGELVTVVDKNISKRRVKAAEYSGWKENRLYFDQTPLREIAMILEDTYGLQVEFADPALAERMVSGGIAAENVGDILTAIEESLDMTALRDQNRVVFTTEKNTVENQ